MSKLKHNQQTLSTPRVGPVPTGSPLGKSARLEPALRCSNIFRLILPIVIASCVFSFAAAQTGVMSLPANGYCKEAKVRAANCKKNWEQIQEFVKTTDGFIKANQHAKVEPNQIGPSYALAKQIERDALALEHMREPAGLDWGLRAKHCVDVLNHAAAELKSLEFGAEMVQKAEKYKVSSMKRRGNAVAKVHQMLGKDQIAKAEAATEEILLDVDEFYPWLSEKSGRQVFGQVNRIRINVPSAANEIRKQETARVLAAALTSATPKIDQLLASAQAAVDSIGSGSVTFGNESLTGDKALLALFGQWQTVHADLIRSLGISLISLDEVDRQSLLGTKLRATTPEEAVAGLNKIMAELLPKLIAADLKQANPSDAQGKYIRYLSALGTMAHRVPDAVLSECKKEIAVLENGNTKLAIDIKNYKRATDDMLMWRKRAAEAGVRSMGETLELVEAGKSIQKIHYVPVLTVPLDKVAVGLNESALNYQTHILNLEAINDKAAFSTYRERTWATIMGEMDISAELASLRSDLLISKTSPPLSADAAISVLTAKRRHLAKAGGPISKVQVEAFGTRFPKLPAAMNSLVPLDQLPGDSENFGDMLLRFNITPTWIQHEHFFKRL